MDEVTGLPRVPTKLWHRGHLTAFVDRHRVAWDLVMAFLTVVYVVLAFREDSSTRVDLYAVWGLAAIFLIEFFARFFDSPKRGRYFRSHWLDLVTAIPAPFVPELRVIRLLRLLRLFKIDLYLRRVLLSHGWTDSSLLWPTLFLFWIASAFALWLVEHDAPGTGINTFGDALTAAFLTAATLGFGKHALPVTLDGQIIAAMIVFFALGLWGYASSRLTQMWLQPRKDASHDQYMQIREDIAALELKLEKVAQKLFGNAEGVAPATSEKPSSRTKR